ncbi:MAG: NAD(P)H-dependent oxidoreductase [Burkholderiaceae bacterium]
MADILILAAHPDLAQSRITSSLIQAARGDASGRIEIRDLYRLYPDYALEVEAEQRALAAARLVVLLHPLHWYGMPALQKLWVDEVLRFGWAYGPGGEALRGKDLWLVSSTGGSAESYSAGGHNEHPIEAFLLPYAQSAKLCGLRFLPPLLLYGAHRVNDAEVRLHAATFAERLASYPAWCPPQPAPPPPDVPMDARPALFSSIVGES